MAENIFSTFSISGAGLSVQRQRLSAVANNIANADTTKAENGKPYQREIIIARGQKQNAFDRELDNQIGMNGTEGNHLGNFSLMDSTKEVPAVQAVSTRDSSEPRMVFDPAHPDANSDGYVAMPNVNIVTEMVDMISAQRAFEANTSVISAAKNIARDSLDI